MVKFEEDLEQKIWPEWKQHYINYHLLKAKLSDILHAQETKQEEIIKARKHIFQGALDEELEKILDFFKERSSTLRAETRQVLRELPGRQLAGTREEQLATLDEAVANLHTQAGKVTHLLDFVSLNMAALRKILKKFKKHIEPLAPMQGFLALEIDHPNEPDFHLSQGTFLPASKAADLAAMNKHADLKQCSADIQKAFGELQKVRHEIVRDAASSQSRAPTGTSRMSQDIQASMFALQEAQASSRQNARFVHALHWSETQAVILTKPPSEENAVATTLGLFMVCAASALYMANYQLCLPTVTEFCRHLGIPSSYAGYIVGSTDIAAIPITIVFSFWSNKSFKTPMLFAAFACIISNLLYCASYDYGGLPLLILSRFMTGLGDTFASILLMSGSSRSVSRRYIADFTPKSKRTPASTAFVCSSAIGMAVGPLISFPLQKVPDTLHHGIRINPITCAGYVMAAAWLVFALICQLFFQEPLDVIRRSSDAAEAQEPLLNADGNENGSADLEEAPTSKLDKDREASIEAEEQKSKEEWQTALAPTIVSIAVLWMLKMVQQGYMDGLSMFTSTFFGWSSADVGLLLTALGISALPVSAAVGIFLSKVKDGTIITVSTIITAIGCLAVGFFCSTLWLYLFGGCCLFLSTLIMEAAGTGALSKVMSVQLQRGILNAGLIATEAGTIGRLTGNAALAIVGLITDTETGSDLINFSRILYCFFVVVLAAVLITVFVFWRKLQV